MAFNYKLAKRQRTNIDEDRLSSLHNDILIDILSRLPFRLAVTTETLSLRWRYLWRDLTWIHISTRNLQRLCELPTICNDIMKQIASPIIHSFSLEIDGLFKDRIGPIYMYNCVEPLRYRNVRELKVSWPRFFNKGLTLPKYFFQVQSLVSIELFFPVPVSVPKDPGPFNLPNLKNLRLSFRLPKDEWLEELIQACPSLEELYLKFFSSPESYVDRCYQRDESKYIECSNEQLKRLHIDLDFSHRVTIRAPKLEYLSVRAPKLAIFDIIEKSEALSEAKIIIFGDNDILSKEETLLVSKFYEAISNVAILSVDVPVVLYNKSTLFRNVTRLRINMKRLYNDKILLSLLELCPVLDDLTLHFRDVSENNWRGIPIQKVGDVSTLSRPLKRVEIVTETLAYRELKTCFFKLIECLLSDATDLEQFVIRVVDDGTNCDKERAERNHRRRNNLSKLMFRKAMGFEQFTPRVVVDDDINCDEESVEFRHKKEETICKVLYDSLLVLTKKEFAFEFVGISFKTSR